MTQCQLLTDSLSKMMLDPENMVANETDLRAVQLSPNGRRILNEGQQALAT